MKLVVELKKCFPLKNHYNYINVGQIVILTKKKYIQKIKFMKTLHK